eukprot:jgi/Chlat1/6714/Chrsp50S06427
MAAAPPGVIPAGGGAGSAGGEGGAGASVPDMTKSHSTTDTIKGSHQFTISGYSLAKGMGIGKYIASETFSVGGYDWAMYFYPDGKNEEDSAQYVSLFIALASEGHDVRALFELMMMDQSDKADHKVHSHFGRALESGPYTLKYRGSMWGYKRFFKRLNLENSGYLKDDTLDIRCTVGVVVSSTTGQQRCTIPVPPSKLGSDLLTLLESGQNTDVVFDVDSEEFRAHKLILCARSPVFQALLNSPMREGAEGKVLVEDVKAPVFKALLQYIYSGSLEDSVLSTNTMAQHLLAAADRFALDRLRLMCEAKLCESLDVSTAATTLALAEQHNAMQLRSVCLQFTAQNLGAVMASEGYEHMSKSCPSLQQALLRAIAGLTGGAAAAALPQQQQTALVITRPQALHVAPPMPPNAAMLRAPAPGGAAPRRQPQQPALPAVAQPQRQPPAVPPPNANNPEAGPAGMYEGDGGDARGRRVRPRVDNQ